MLGGAQGGTIGFATIFARLARAQGDDAQLHVEGRQATALGWVRAGLPFRPGYPTRPHSCLGTAREMTDFAQARRMMVEGQIRTNDVTELNVLAAFDGVPRERFVPERWQAIAYLDRDVPVGDSGARCLLKPMVLAKLIQAAAVGEGDRVLDVGCATGYSSAVLAKLSRLVVALEEDDALAASAARTLGAIGVGNARVVTGKLADGWPREAPYDVILLNGSTEIAPQPLLDQLADGGRLVAVAGRAPIGRGTVYRRSGTHVSAHPEFDAVAPLLPGFSKPPAFVF